MSDTELMEKLKLINEAMAAAAGDPIKEKQNLEAIIDPADATMCEGCQ